MRALRMFVWMAFLTGFLYPLTITLIATLAVPKKASGSFVKQGLKVVGSSLIGQNFESDKYFWPRPSATGYNPLPSRGSNLGPTSAKLKREVEMRRLKYQNSEVPSELLYATASGLDPHITIRGANFQIDRIAKARNLEIEELKKLVDSMTHKRRFGFIGPKYVNVLQLNLALDEREEKYAKKSKT